MIRFEKIRKVFGHGAASVVAVDDVSLEIARQEIVCLIGTSGSGKTTLLKMVNRLVEPSDGQIWIDGEPVRDLDVIRLRRNIGYVIQRGGLFPHLSVARNVGLLCDLEGWSPDKIQQRVEALLDLVDLPPSDFAERLPGALSGGQQQRVGVARALALDPSILLMDEPFGAVDPITRHQLRRDFLALARRVEKTIVLVTHDLAEAFMLGDRIVLMDRGRIVQVGREDDLRQRPADPFVRAFIGAHTADLADSVHES